MNEGKMLTENALALIAQDMKTNYLKEPLNRDWYVAVCRNAAEQFANMRADNAALRADNDQMAGEVERVTQENCAAKKLIQYTHNEFGCYLPDVYHAKYDHWESALAAQKLPTTREYPDCPYWTKDGCTGHNCCKVTNCIHAAKSQPWQKGEAQHEH